MQCCTSCYDIADIYNKKNISQCKIKEPKKEEPCMSI